MSGFSRRVLAAIGCGLFFSASPVLAQDASGEPSVSADVLKIFGRDPGLEGANACCVRSYSNRHLADHPNQNVVKMAAFISKRQGEGSSYYLTGLEVYFRELKQPFRVFGACQAETEGKAGLGCGIDCDGGWIGIRAKDKGTLLVDIPERARVYDTAPPPDAEEGQVPEKARFGSDDKVFRLTRTDLKDCLSLVTDEELKEKIRSGQIKD